MNRQMVEEFLQTVRNEPELRAEVRRELLTEELLEVPKTVARLATGVESLQKHAEATNRRLDRIEKEVKDGFAEVRSDVSDVSDIRQQAETDRSLLVSIGTAVGALSGLAVESVLQGRVMETLDRRTGMVDPVALVSMQLPNRVDEEFKGVVNRAAESAPPVITTGDSDRLLSTDLIIRGRHGETGSITYLAVEASHTVQTDDVRKVAHSRRALGILYPNAEVIGAVFGVNVPDDVKRTARAAGLTIYEIQLPT